MVKQGGQSRIYRYNYERTVSRVGTHRTRYPFFSPCDILATHPAFRIGQRSAVNHRAHAFSKTRCKRSCVHTSTYDLLEVFILFLLATGFFFLSKDELVDGTNKEDNCVDRAGLDPSSLLPRDLFIFLVVFGK